MLRRFSFLELFKKISKWETYIKPVALQRVKVTFENVNLW